MSFLFQVAAISEQASEQTGDPSPEKISSPSLWKLFDMHAVVDSTEDIFNFILSEKGHRVRLFLLRDIVEAADVFLQDEVIDFPLNERPQGQRILLFEVFYINFIFVCVCVCVFVFMACMEVSILHMFSCTNKHICFHFNNTN